MIDDLNKKRLEVALEASGFDLWENDLVTGEVLSGLKRVYADLGFTPADIAARIDDIFDLMHADDIEPTKKAVEEHLNGLTDRYYCEFRLRHRDGHWVWFANYGRIVDRVPGESGGRLFTGVSFNIAGKRREEAKIRALNKQLADQNAQLEAMNAELEKLATRDSLTGLTNRRCLFECGDAELKRAQRLDRPLSMLVIDIDLFKRINDTWGHQAGDRAICAVGERCAQHIRETVDTLGRIGGEEFAVVLPELTLEEALVIAERLRTRVSEAPVTVMPNKSTRVTVSIGAASRCDADEAFGDLFARADRALYRAKKSGRDRSAAGAH